MKTWVCVFTLIGIVALSACQSSVPSTPAAPRAAVDAATTTAWGKLVDDPSGKPLRGVRVALEPWKPCRAKPDVPWANRNQKPWNHHETLVCPKAIVTAATRRDGRFSFRAPAGHYLLVIGSDDPSDLTRPTIHDQVWLGDGSQHLLAPTPCPTIYPRGKVPAGARCLPPIPQITFSAPERDGDYRLVTISHWEKPCIRAFDAYRAKWNLDPAVVDEWLTENNRAQLRQVQVPSRVLYGNGNITAGATYEPSGDPNCGLSLMKLAGIFENNVAGSLFYSADPRVHWLGALNETFVHDRPRDAWISNGEYPRDPRDWVDRLYPSWP
jgi:hypothetical protein